MNDQAHHYTKCSRAFLFGVILNVAFVVVKAGYGFAADSPLLPADGETPACGIDCERQCRQRQKE